MNFLTDLVQGSKEWKEVRKQHFTASECPAMLGLSKYTTRNELLEQKATGVTPEVSPSQQRLFDKGHKVEEMARPIAEAFMDEEVYPATITNEVEGLKSDQDSLNEFYRQFPRTTKHAFRDESKQSLFNLTKIYQQVDYNEELNNKEAIANPSCLEFFKNLNKFK